MSRDLILARSRSSPRVRLLSATAIRVAVYECCGHIVDPTAAELLARNLTPMDAVERFRQQAKVPRHEMSEAQLATYRTFIVAAEAVEEGSRTGVHDQAPDRELLDRIRSVQETISQAQNTQEKLEQLSRQLDRSGSRFRQFIRKADRLWREQLSQLKARIYDPEHYDAAVTELAVLYMNAYRDALKAGEVTLGQKN